MDDGLLLNLAPSDGSASVKSAAKVQGGRWKDRLKAKRAAKKGDGSVRPKTKKPETNGSTGSVPEFKRTPKGTGANSAPFVPRSDSKKRKERENDDDRKVKRTTVDRRAIDGTSFVSSLFSSSPAVSNKPEESADAVPQEATNAPLKDDSTFEGLGLNAALSKDIEEKMGFPRPTPIQRAAIPSLISEDRDMFLQAQTGSGKTLAYLLPVFQRLMSEKLDRTSGLFAIILAPTRELSTQIYAVMEKVKHSCHWLVPGIVVGGEKKKAEKARIRKGINVLVATPGRLVDHFDNTKSLDLSDVRWLIFDEGDRMMELGFEEDIKHIINRLDSESKVASTAPHFPALPKKRVTVLCSATMKDNVKKLGDTSLTDANWVTADKIKDMEEQSHDRNKHVAPAQLMQQYVVVPAKLRLVTLTAILKNITASSEAARIMVFFSCTDSVEFHFSAFTRDGKDPLTSGGTQKDDEDDTAFSTVLTAPLLGDGTVVYKLHGSLNQKLRTSTMSAFSKPPPDAKHSILFCTDVASRGLDLPLITNVVEFDPPFALEDHIHRVGRTARAGHAGTSILVLLPGKEEKYVQTIEPSHPGGLAAKRHETLLQNAFGKKWEVDATTWHLDTERWLLEDSHAMDLAKRAFTSHIRAYATHLSSEREVFDLKALHLGHIAKSFALRETPGNISGHSSSKSSKSSGSSTKSKSAKSKDPKSLMLSMARKHQAMSEFNLG